MHGLPCQRQSGGLFDCFETDESLIPGKTGHLTEGGTGQHLANDFFIIIEYVQFAGDQDLHINALIARTPDDVLRLKNASATHPQDMQCFFPGEGAKELELLHDLYETILIFVFRHTATIGGLLATTKSGPA